MRAASTVPSAVIPTAATYPVDFLQQPLLHHCLCSTYPYGSHSSHPNNCAKYSIDFPAATAIAAVASVAAIPAAAAPHYSNNLSHPHFSSFPWSRSHPGATPLAITPAAVTIASAAPAVLWEHTKMAVRERRTSARTLGLMAVDLEISLWTRRM
jgi:hypothetical protein